MPKQKFDVDVVVARMLKYMKGASVRHQLRVGGAIQTIAIRNISTSQLVEPVSGRVVRIPLVKPVPERIRAEAEDYTGEEAPAFIRIPCFEIHLSDKEDPQWWTRTVARKFGEAILLSRPLLFPEVKRLRERMHQPDLSRVSRRRAREGLRQIHRTFAKRWLEQGTTNHRRLARILGLLAKRQAQRMLPEISLLK